MSAETCPKMVWDGGFSSYICGRPVKRDGLCGIHAAAEERKDRNEAARRAALAEQDAKLAREDKLQQRIRDLGGKWPITREELIALLEARHV